MNIKDNIDSWNVDYHWSNQGEEWSEPWGNSMAQWINLIYPRIFRFLPTNKILEIGSGYGRWTDFLKNYSGELICVDLSERCINYCKERFMGFSNINFYLNNGLNFPTVENESIDFVFSFDSLVHCDSYIMESYLEEISRVLKKDGIAFIHHSNLLGYKKSEGLQEHARALDVNYKKIKMYSKKVGLNCIIQELVNWRNPENFLIDCFSTFAKNKLDESGYKLFKNTGFMNHADLVKQFSHYYK